MILNSGEKQNLLDYLEEQRIGILLESCTLSGTDSLAIQMKRKKAHSDKSEQILHWVECIEAGLIEDVSEALEESIKFKAGDGNGN